MSGAPPVLRFGVYELNLASEELRKFGTLIRLSPQPFELLALLASQAGQVVTREQIQHQLWGQDTFVDFEQGMNHCIKQIRSALSDSSDTPRYIETIPRRGYRFIAPVEVIRPDAPPSLVTDLRHADAPSDAAPTGAAVSAAPVAGPSAQPDVSSPTSPAEAPVAEAPVSIRKKGAVVWIASAAALLLVGVVAFTVWRYRSANPAGTAPDVKHRRSVAVLGFNNVGGNPDPALATELAVMLETELGAGQQLRIVPGENVDRLKHDIHIPTAASLAPDTLRRVGKALNADYVVFGSYIDSGQPGEKYRLDLRVQDAAGGETFYVKETGSDLFDLISRTGASIRPRLGVADVSQNELSGIRATLPVNPEAARLYYEGLARLRAFDGMAARDLLQRAVHAEPQFAPAHSALAQALNYLGYSKLAQGEAKQAFELSANLPHEDRLLMEARYRELSHQWDDAIRLYQQLWETSRDNIEYGLLLASVQTRANRGKDAVATVASLRTLLPPPARDDLRIDLEEANAAFSLSDYKLAKAASDQAFAKAQAQGSGYAMARARIEQARALFYLGNLDEAMKLFRESQATSQAAGDKRQLATALNNIAGALQEQGDLAPAQELYANALALYREIGNRRFEASCLSNLGAVYQRRGDLVPAQDMYRQALSIYLELDDVAMQGLVTNNLAEVLQLNGDLASAGKLHAEALELARKSGNQSDQAYALFGLGEVLAAQGEVAAARQKYQQALQIRNDLQEADSIQHSILALAALSLAEGHAADAEDAARKAVEEFRKLKLPDNEVEAEIVLARALLAQGKASDAAQVSAQAQAIAAHSQNRITRLNLAIASAQSAAASGQKSAVEAATANLLRIATEAASNHYRATQFEAELALGEIELQSGRASDGRARLQRLRQQATARDSVPSPAPRSPRSVALSLLIPVTGSAPPYPVPSMER